jgi:hypothetical protein
VRARAFPWVVAVLAAACLHQDLHLRRGFVMKEAVYPEDSPLRPIPARQAIRSAIQSLQARGVRRVRICAIAWVVAPLGGALIEATGQLEVQGIRLTAFSVGIHDGTEGQDLAAASFSSSGAASTARARSGFTFRGEGTVRSSSMTTTTLTCISGSSWRRPRSCARR